MSFALPRSLIIKMIFRIFEMKGGDAMSTFMSPISDHSFESYREFCRSGHHHLIPSSSGSLRYRSHGETCKELLLNAFGTATSR